MEERTSLVLLARRVQIVALALRDGGGDPDRRLLGGGKAAEALLPARLLRLDHGLEWPLLALGRAVDAVVSGLATTALEEQVAPELVLELSIIWPVGHGLRQA